MTDTTYRRKYGNGHSYVLDGVPKVKGVTTMMRGLGGPPESYFTGFTADYAVDNWDRLTTMTPAARRAEIADATKSRFKTASVKGTRVHALAEPLAKGETVPVPDDIRGYVEACLQFINDYDLEVIASEAALFSRRYKYAGSADAFGTVAKPLAGLRTRVLIDWKTTSKDPWGSVAFQLSGYRYADIMLSGDGGKDSVELAVPEVDECWAVWLRADGYDVFPMDTSPEILNQLRHIDQCRLADEECRNYRGSALPHPGSVRRMRLAEVEAEQ